MSRLIKVTTPWDGTSVDIIVGSDFSRYDRARLEAGKCMYGVCHNGWMYLITSKQKGYVKQAMCDRCTELRLLRSMLSGFSDFKAENIWFVEKGKLKLDTAVVKDTRRYVEAFRERVLKTRK